MAAAAVIRMMTRRNRLGRRPQALKPNVNLGHLQLLVVCAFLLVQGGGGTDEVASGPNGQGSEGAALEDLKAKFEHLSNKLEGLTVSDGDRRLMILCRGNSPFALTH